MQYKSKPISWTNVFIMEWNFYQAILMESTVTIVVFVGLYEFQCQYFIAMSKMVH